MRMRTCVQQLYVLRYALVQATVGVGTVIIPYIGVAYTRGGGIRRTKCTMCMQGNHLLATGGNQPGVQSAKSIVKSGKWWETIMGQYRAVPRTTASKGMHAVKVQELHGLVHNIRHHFMGSISEVRHVQSRIYFDLTRHLVSGGEET